MALSTVVVCVTGGSGFVGSHCIQQLLQAGYTVRTTVRSLDKAKLDIIRNAVAPTPLLSSRLTFHKADLLSDDGWREALSGCTYVLHVASPLVLSEPKDENELIRPAVEGTLRVLRTATAVGVQRVVLTSSYLAVGSGHQGSKIATHDETIWTNEAGLGSVGAYTKSKVRAERAAWDYAKSHASPELTVICPHLIFGPLLPGMKDARSSLDLVLQIQQGKIPIAPRLTLGIVDVRDVAALHILAMTAPQARGERFIAAADANGKAEEFTIQELGTMLGKKIRVMPDSLARMIGFFVPDVKLMTLDLGVKKTISTAKVRKAFGYEFRTVRETVRETAQSVDALKA